ncbi:MAG: CDP-diacylglycerol--glycerol-3-phosphate 3-phosphatidyltransferase [Pseudomonadota bacterium]
MKWNLANTITGIRIIAIPLLAIVYFLPFEWANNVGASVFIVAAISDFFDGYIARKFNQETPFGAFLDPVADKLIVAVALVMLVHIDGRWMMVMIAAIIIGREITVSALREWMASQQASARVAVSMVGKLKTTFQLVGLSFALWADPLLGLPIYDMGFTMLLGAAALTLWSMWVYLSAAWPVLTGNKAS